MVRYMRKSHFWAIVVLVLLITAQLTSASAFLGKDRYVSAVGDSLDDDLYLGCEHGAIDGYIANDLIVAAQRYSLSGEVGGNLNSASQYATIQGTVGQSARMFAERITIDGQISNNLIVFAKDVEIGRSAWVGRDALIMGSDLSISGTIEGDLIIRGDQVVISGTIRGNVDIESNRLTLLSPAEITGNLKYKSKKEIKIDDDVVVVGEIDWIEITSKDEDYDSDDGDDIPFGLRIILFLATLVSGLIVIGIFGHHTKAASAITIKSPLRTLGVGVVAVLFGPLAILILLPTVIGTPVSIILMFVYTIFFYLSKIYVALPLGQLIFNRLLGKYPKQGWSFVLGLTVITLLFWIPVIGWFIYFVTIFFGFGAILWGIRRCNSSGDTQNPGDLQAQSAQPEPPVSPPAPPAS